MNQILFIKLFICYLLKISKLTLFDIINFKNCYRFYKHLLSNYMLLGFDVGDMLMLGIVLFAYRDFDNDVKWVWGFGNF